MTSSKHFKDLPADVPTPPSDLKRNPGIGQSRGAFARTEADPDIIEGDNTVKGDVGNNTNPAGGTEGTDEGRTNK